MPKINKNNEDYKNEIKVRQGKSRLSEFVKRPLPTDDEVEEFEEIIGEEIKEDEIDESLSKIYQDEKGNVVDVKKLNIKKKQSLFFWFLNLVFLSAVLIGLGYGVYYYICHNSSDAAALEFSISGQGKVVAGEEFFSTIGYKNLSSVNIKNVRIEIIYPKNFIFLDSLPVAGEKNFVWQIGDLPVGGNGAIKIKGKIIDVKGGSGTILAKMMYMPENFSSEFRKEASQTFSLEDTGIDFAFDYSSAVLAGEENEITIKVKSQEKNFLSQFRLTVDSAENLEIISVVVADEQDNQDNTGLSIKEISPGVWNISGLKEEEREFKINYKLNKKMADNQDIILRFENSAEDDKIYSFLEEKISVEVMKSDLNLTLIINGSKNDQAVKFGDKLNYSIAYANKGETSMKNLVIMAVLESDFFDWTTLEDSNNGREKGNTVTWTREEIPTLEELASNQEGIIDFSLNILAFKEEYLKHSAKDFQIKSYAQFSISNSEEFVSGSGESLDNRSNIIVNKINSDLSLKEEVRYFDQDNMHVGEGPLPPKVGETTSFKVYWTLTNNLHELQDAKVEVILPSYVSWNEKSRTYLGTVKYDSESHKVTWQIGRLPITVYRADAEFSIQITPEENDRNKIMILLPGAKVSALDIETKGLLESTTKAKTTKLEDDEIAGMNSDGRVE